MRYCVHCHTTHLGKAETCPDCGNPLEKKVPKTEGLCFSGMYILPMDDDGFQYCYFLRFYPDFHVIAVSSTGDPLNVARWFDYNKDDKKETRAYSLGKYALDKGEIIFRVTSKNGDVDYQGKVEDRPGLQPALVLDSKSRINGYEAFGQEYLFVPLDE